MPCLLLHLANVMPCLLSRLAIIMFCLLSCLVVPHLTLVPCQFHILFSCLVTFYYHVLLLLHLATLTPCCLTVVALPLRVATLPSRLVVRHFQVPPTPPPPIVVLLPCCSFSCLITMPCQLVLPLHSLLQVEELEATPINFIQ